MTPGFMLMYSHVLLPSLYLFSQKQFCSVAPAWATRDQTQASTVTVGLISIHFSDVTVENRGHAGKGRWWTVWYWINSKEMSFLLSPLPSLCFWGNTVVLKSCSAILWLLDLRREFYSGVSEALKWRWKYSSLWEQTLL